jgi:CubicO group peptidase (beta-lactamase class C family)
MFSPMCRTVAVCTALCALTVATPSQAQAQQCPAGVSYPGAQWPEQLAQTAAAQRDAIAALESFAFTLTGSDQERLGARTDSVIIVRRGVIVYERYGRGWTAEQPHFTWSVTKSLTNVLTGIAVSKGYLSIDDSLCRWMPMLRADLCAVKVRNTLEFSTGIDWAETYENGTNQDSSVLAMLYGVGHGDAAGFVGTHPPKRPPGSAYMYSSGDTNLLSRAMDRAFSAAGEDSNYPWRYLFEPLQIQSAVLERDETATPIGSSYWYAIPRDMARFGYFLLRDGCWNNTRILPPGWVADSTAVNPAIRLMRLDADDDDVQGRQFWLNAPVPELGVTVPWPGVPADAYAARGHWGQSITVVPSREVVIVRTADDRDGRFDYPRFVSLALAVTP